MDVNRNGKVIDISASTRQKHSPPHKDKAKKKSRKISGIVVGIDFGNTFTGVSYAYQNGGEMIDVVKWYAFHVFSMFGRKIDPIL